MNTVRITCGDMVRECSEAESMDVAGELLAKTGLDHKALKFDKIEYPGFHNADGSSWVNDGLSSSAPTEVSKAVAKGVSTFGDGNQVVDAEARTRIESMHDKLKAAGVAVDASQQLYATGTRMAEVGYSTQAARAVEHEKKLPLNRACAALSERVEREAREDVIVSAREFADSIQVNGKVKAFGLMVTEQAMRGLCSRLESPAIRYLLGLRDRIAEEAHAFAMVDGVEKFVGDMVAIRKDRAMIADVLRHECLRRPDVSLKLRTRKSVGDVFAVLSPSYTPADAPEVVAQLVDELPADARGTWSYDPVSTAWELRAHVWTPTPVADQAVGEPFEGYASFSARDNGTARFRGGGGVTFVRCLNASTYMADGQEVSRVHRANVLVNVEEMLRTAMTSIDALTAAWGENRESPLELPKKVTIEDAIPGFYRYMLTDRRSELAGVLPGRSEKHAQELARVFPSERRDPAQLVRADLANGFTRYIQSFDTPTRRTAEQKVGEWLVSGKKVGCLLEEKEDSSL